MDSNKRRIDKELGIFLHNCYVNSGKTIEELAWAINVEPRTLNYYFSGERKPSQRTLLKLVKVAKVVLYNLPWFGGVDVANSSKTIQTRVEYSRSTSSFVFIGSNQHDSAS